MPNQKRTVELILGRKPLPASRLSAVNWATLILAVVKDLKLYLPTFRYFEELTRPLYAYHRYSAVGWSNSEKTNQEARANALRKAVLPPTITLATRAVIVLSLEWLDDQVLLTDKGVLVRRTYSSSGIDYQEEIHDFGLQFFRTQDMCATFRGHPEKAYDMLYNLTKLVQENARIQRAYAKNADQLAHQTEAVIDRIEETTSR